MDYHEAKYRTLWKLAFCVVEEWDGLGRNCNFCEVTKQFFPYLDGLDAPDCGKCPIDKLCDEYSRMLIDNNRYGIKINYRYLFNQLLIIEVPE